MGEQEKKKSEGEEQPEREATIRDLDVPEDDAEDVKGGIQDSERRPKN